MSWATGVWATGAWAGTAWSEPGAVVEIPVVIPTRPYRNRKDKRDWLEEQRKIIGQIRRQQDVEEMKQIQYLTQQLANTETKAQQLARELEAMKIEQAQQSTIDSTLTRLQQVLGIPSIEQPPMRATSSIQKAEQARIQAAQERQNQINAQRLANLQKAREAQKKARRKK